LARTRITGPSSERGRENDGIARVNSSAHGLFGLGSLPSDAGQLSTLFHRLNNQLGVVLACAELLEARAADDASRARAAEAVAKVLEAMGTAREIRQQSTPAPS
jgi:predicted deacylase